ncbi:MAG: DUF6036 family nucleotidyltransferase [Candidatus Kryptoniota bacterium]
MKLAFSNDISEFLLSLYEFHVRYLVVGGEAVIYYGHARLTGDIDIFYDVSEENVKNLYAALVKFWSGDVPGIENEGELAQRGTIFQFGVPPNRIDLISEIEGVEFQDAWKNRVEEKFDWAGKEMVVYYIGLDDLIKNKNAVRRHKDLDDLEFLIRVSRRK